jgi:hypothetical protein
MWIRWIRIQIRIRNTGYGSSLGSKTDISQKYKMGDISKEVANTQFRHDIKQENAHLLATAALWVRKQTSRKYTKWAT